MRRTLACVLVAGALLTGCNAGGAPDDAPAAVVQALARVDSALAARDWAGARSALDELVRRTVLARRSGDLSEEHADRILAAAAELASGVPRTSPAASPTASPSPSATAVRTTAPSPRETQEPDRKPRGRGKGKGR